MSDVASPAASAAARWMVEAALGLGLAGTLPALLGAPPGAAGLYPFAVGLVAAEHGLLPGVTTGLAAAALLLHGMGLAPPDVLAIAGPRDGIAAAFAQVALGAVIGLVGERARRTHGRARAGLAELEEQLGDLDRRLASVLGEKAALERRFAREVLPVEAIAREAEGLLRLAPGEAIDAALRLAERFLAVRGVGLHLPQEGRLPRVASIGEVPAATAYAGEDDLVMRALREQRAVATRTRAAHQRAGAWLATPVPAASGGFHGVLAVYDLPFARLTPTALAVLDELAGWLGRALDAAADERRKRPGNVTFLPAADAPQVLPEAG